MGVPLTPTLSPEYPEREQRRHAALVTSPILCYSSLAKGCEQDEYPPYANRDWGAWTETPLAPRAAKTTWEPGPERPMRPPPNRC